MGRKAEFGWSIVRQCWKPKGKRWVAYKRNCPTPDVLPIPTFPTRKEAENAVSTKNATELQS
jgi:hypothetical protein